MKEQLKQLSQFAVPALLMTMMTGCASVSDLEKVQQQVDELRATANNANAVASSAIVTAQEAKAAANSAIAAAEESKSLASNARSTASAASATAASAEKASAEASVLAAAAAKNAEAAAGAALEAEKTVKAATITFPAMRFDPASGRFFVQWYVWPSMAEYTGTPPAPTVAPEAPAAAGGK